jgi:uncharacterized protein (DUF427 family)
MPDYPSFLSETNQVEPVPRRIRAVLAGETVVDTTDARYVWEWTGFPQYYIPLADIRAGVLVDEDGTEETPRGDVKIFGVRVGEVHRPKAAKVLGAAKVDGLDDTVRFEWSAFDAWYEEDEQVFVHPRNPYVRVDALRSHRHVRVSLEGITLADSTTPVLVFETGLPTRYYFDRTDVDFGHLAPTSTQTACPYKGVTSGYWSVRTGDEVRDGHQDLAWAYDFPTRQLLPIAGLVAFYNEKTDIDVDGVRLPRPRTHFSQ